MLSMTLLKYPFVNKNQKSSSFIGKGVDGNNLIMVAVPLENASLKEGKITGRPQELMRKLFLRKSFSQYDFGGFSVK